MAQPVIVDASGSGAATSGRRGQLNPVAAPGGARPGHIAHGNPGDHALAQANLDWVQYEEADVLYQPPEAMPPQMRSQLATKLREQLNCLRIGACCTAIIFMLCLLMLLAIYINQLNAEPDSVTTPSFVDGQTEGIDLADNAVVERKLVDTAVRERTIGEGQVEERHLRDVTLITAHFQYFGVMTDDIANEGITASRISDRNVTSSKVAAAQVSTAKLLASSVVTADIAAGSLTTAKVVDEAVQSLHINDGAITTAKLGAGAVESQHLNLLAGLVVKSGVLDVEPNTPSTDKDTGAVVVTNGGFGIERDGYIGGAVSSNIADVTGSSSLNSATVAGTTRPGGLFAVASNLNVASGTSTNNGRLLAGVTVSSPGNITAASSITAGNGIVSGGRLMVTGQTAVGKVVAADSSVAGATSGSVRTAGGAAVAKNAYFGTAANIVGDLTANNLNVNGAFDADSTSNIAGNTTVAGQINAAGGNVDSAAGSLSVFAAVTVGGNSRSELNGQVTVADASDVTTGPVAASVKADGGLAVAKSMFVGDTAAIGTTLSTGSLNVAGNLVCSGSSYATLRSTGPVTATNGVTVNNAPNVQLDSAGQSSTLQVTGANLDLQMTGTGAKNLQVKAIASTAPNPIIVDVPNGGITIAGNNLNLGSNSFTNQAMLSDSGNINIDAGGSGSVVTAYSSGAGGVTDASGATSALLIDVQPDGTTFSVPGGSQLVLPTCNTALNGQLRIAFNQDPESELWVDSTTDFKIPSGMAMMMMCESGTWLPVGDFTPY